MKTMPENKFEKQVQRKMEEFGLNPSSRVWDEVEERINKKRRKRKIAFWLLLFLLISLSSITTGILILKDKKKSNEQSYLKNKKQELSDFPVMKPAETTKPVDGNQNTKSTPEKIIGKSQIKSNNHNSIALTQSTIVNRKGDEKDNKKTETAKEEDKSVISEWQVSDNVKQIVDSTFVVNNSQPDKSDTLDEKEKINSETSISSEIKNEVEQKPVLQEKKDSANTSNQATGKQPVSSLHTKKWKFGLTIEGGIAEVAKGIGFVSSYPASVYQAPSSGGGSSTISLSPVYASGAFTAGVFVQRSLSKKLLLDMGLSYSFLSTKRKVGNKIDSTISNPNTSQGSITNFYLGANADNAYTNHYHFLNISGGIEWRIFKKNFVFWKNEFSYCRLLSSDELYFDSGYLIYYRDFSQLNKNHFFLSTGLSIPAGNRFDLEAFLKYDLTPTSANKNIPPAHFTYYGIGIKYFLSGKK
ncbi:MAG: hypothetical protein JST17_02340 [Bacteroidetes bacterium]|nr:hypothetical protein [Bacteroidota bacterium]MBS1931333.1 hypothetical protein [Bacteroidota bacterium]